MLGRMTYHDASSARGATRDASGEHVTRYPWLLWHHGMVRAFLRLDVYCCTAGGDVRRNSAPVPWDYSASAEAGVEGRIRARALCSIPPRLTSASRLVGLVVHFAHEDQGPSHNSWVWGCPSSIWFAVTGSGLGSWFPSPPLTPAQIPVPQIPPGVWLLAGHPQFSPQDESDLGTKTRHPQPPVAAVCTLPLTSPSLHALHPSHPHPSGLSLAIFTPPTHTPPPLPPTPPRPYPFPLTPSSGPISNPSPLHPGPQKLFTPPNSAQFALKRNKAKD